MKKHLISIKKFLNFHKLLCEFVFVFLLFIVVSLIYSFLFKYYPLENMVDAFRYNGYQMYIIKYSLFHYGQFGLWDQFLSGGMSWVSHPGGPLFFPTAWLIIFLINNFILGSITLFFFHLLTGAGAFYFLLRVLGMQRITSFFVSISYIATQYVFVFLISGWFEEFFGLTLLPLTAGLLILALSKKNYWYAVLGGIIMSMNFFGNTYYVFHYNAIVLIYVSLFLGITKIFKKRKRSKLNFRHIYPDILINLCFWGIFIGLAAVKLIPLLEFRNISARNVLPLSAIETSDSVMTFTFFFNRLHNFLFPVESFSGVLKILFQLGNNIALILIFISFYYAIFKKNIKALLFVSLLLIGCWGYLANRLPIDFYALAYYLLPGFNSNQFPYRFTIIINFAFFVCFALGFDMIMNQKKKYLIFLGYFIGSIFIINGFLFISSSYNNHDLVRKFDIENELKKSLTFNIEKNDNNTPPEISGKVNTNLFSVLTHVFKKYKNDARLHSTFISGDNVITSDQLLLGELQSVQNSYDAIVPTYQYGVIKNLNTLNDSLDTYVKQFKIYSILNTKYHMQQKENSEYGVCYDPAFSTNDNGNINGIYKESQKGICEFLRSRLTSILTDNKGSIFYDSKVLPRVALIRKGILIINDNRFKDYSGFIAKKIMFHPDFDEKKLSIFSGGSSYLDDYSLEDLKKFSAILIIDPKVKNKINAEKLFSAYKKYGGNVLRLNSKYTFYENLHKRSLSIWTEESAWSYSEEDEIRLSELFKVFNKVDSDVGDIKVDKFTPEDLLFKVSTKSENVVFQYSDSFFPGWKAIIDDKPTRVYMADGLVKGIIIPVKGTHTIRLYYEPDSFKKGAFISIMVFLILIGAATYQLFKFRQRLS